MTLIKLTSLLSEGKKVKVPTFKTSKQAEDFVKNLKFDDVVAKDVFDPETGEVYMEQGWSKKKIAKNKAKNKHQFDMIKDLDTGEYWGRSEDVGDLQKFYLIKFEDLDKGWSEKERDKMFDAGYDVSVNLPKSIMRRDKKPFTENDVEVLKTFEAFWNKDKMKRFHQGIKYVLNPQVGKKMATSDVIYY